MSLAIYIPFGDSTPLLVCSGVHVLATVHLTAGDPWAWSTRGLRVWLIFRYIVGAFRGGCAVHMISSRGYGCHGAVDVDSSARA